MQLADLPDVLAIDRVSFPTPAQQGLYEHELQGNKLAHYQVLAAAQTLIGYAGFWMMVDEAHISTIAVHTKWRGRGLGELLLLNLLFLAGDLGATLATLEVRCRNVTAQSLYEKYQFELVGKRLRYYRDTGEDALLMSVQLKDDYYSETLALAKEALFTRLRSAG